MDTLLGKITPKRNLNLFVVIILGVLILAIAIAAGVIGSRSASEEECNCINKLNAGWRGFSIAYVALTILALIGLIVWGAAPKKV